jgi:hypothetical protein
METVSFLTDVHGPRLTGSPITLAAGEWAKGRLTEWGLQSARFETWGPFGRGWTLEGATANMVKPSFSPLIAWPKAWCGSTPKMVRGQPVYFEANTEADLEKYRGKLARAIVLLSPPRDVKALFDPPAKRQTDEALLSLANSDGQRSFRGPNIGTPNASSGGNAANNAGANAAAGNAQPTPSSSRFGYGSPEQRAALQLQTKKWQMIYDEGAAVVLEPGRGDGGTVFVGSATLPPQRSEGPRGAGDNNPFSRGPRPWAKDAPQIVPQMVMAVEHYNRIVRMVQKGAPVELEIDIATRYYEDDLNSFNVLAEIPGTDLKDEVVMLGGHFDSWHSGTGATDNAVGCAVAMEAVRILQAIGAKPRRTVRIALWTGEEQGLLGSRAYVSEHFGKSVTPTRAGGATGGARGGDGAGRSGEGGSRGEAQNGESGGDASRNAQQRERTSSTRYELKPAHEKFSAYFNLDNGTGKIRGIYLQGNEAVRPIFRAWLSPFAEMGASTITLANTGGTDHLSFDGIGLPGFQFIQDPLEYDSRTHHSSMDVYERIQEDDVKQASIIMATFVYHTAMRDERLPRKPLSGEVVTAAAEAAETK